MHREQRFSEEGETGNAHRKGLFTVGEQWTWTLLCPIKTSETQDLQKQTDSELIGKSPSDSTHSISAALSFLIVVKRNCTGDNCIVTRKFRQWSSVKSTIS